MGHDIRSGDCRIRRLYRSADSSAEGGCGESSRYQTQQSRSIRRNLRVLISIYKSFHSICPECPRISFPFVHKTSLTFSLASTFLRLKGGRVVCCPRRYDLSGLEPAAAGSHSVVRCLFRRKAGQPQHLVRPLEVFARPRYAAHRPIQPKALTNLISFSSQNRKIVL